MPSLARNLRKDLETAVKQARRSAEAGARKALELLAVGHHEPWSSLTSEQRKLRNRLRAHSRQLGDAHDPQRGTQVVTRISSEVAYEHWHRMLFARFLAENDLLIEPQSDVAITLDECREMAREQGQDWLPVACAYAEGMLPQIFRRGDPVLEVSLPPETRSELEDILKAQPREVFLADDSLGWVYQFWQTDRKDEVNQSEKKIGADELPAVTQLFTEDYMVEFLLHNTLGAWWAGKTARIAGICGESEDAVRALVALSGVKWTYLRFVKDDVTGTWRPAAGTFDGWPREARALRMLDPCMGSGHFLLFALPILVALRRKEEGLSVPEAIKAVLSDNLFGLEIDQRCTQIAAFNLALAAWKLGGYQPLPSLHLACSGLSVGAEKQAWLKLADRASARSPLAEDPQLFGGGGNLADNLGQHLRFGMDQLYDLFKQAPILGSLLNPRRLDGEGLLSRWDELKPLLEQALASETSDDEASEIAVTAKGLAKAAEILSGQFTLVATNVPYLGRGKQDDALKEYCERVHPEAKADLATCFVERCLGFCASRGSVALVTPQNWLFLGTYQSLRSDLFRRTSWEIVAKLGPAAFEDMNWWAANTAVFVLSMEESSSGHQIAGFDVSKTKDVGVKARLLSNSPALIVKQGDQLRNPDARLLLSAPSDLPLLQECAESYQGISPADFAHFGRFFWEVTDFSQFRFWQSTIEETVEYGGRELLIWWSRDLDSAVAAGSAFVRGEKAWGNSGVVVRQMRHLPCTLYTGEAFDTNCAVIVPRSPSLVPAIWAFCSSEIFLTLIREIDQKTNVTNATLVKVPFDLPHWQKVAAEKYPHGLPQPFSSDSTQWLFNGHPVGAVQSLHVAVARLLGYQWPRQTGSSFPNCPALTADSFDKLVDKDGIVCLSATKGEAPAADRLNALLAVAFGSEWSATKARELLAMTGSKAKTLTDWLGEDFFEQHCDLFHQRPFIWHIWDGLKGGFSALVNYHRLVAGNGAGKRTLDKLIYTYLGEWIDAQRKAQKAGFEGADARLTAAEHLRRQLEAILAGEPPFDLFVRWTALNEQPIGWNPDINDGVRLNMRPFINAKPLNARGKNACILRATPRISWDKDRGKEPHRAKADFPWFWTWDETTVDFEGGATFDGNRWNDCHYSNTAKQDARERHAQKR